MTTRHKPAAGHAHHPKGHAPVKIAKAKANKMTSGLVALSSAAVLAVYAAGYAKTKAAADRLEEASARRGQPGDGQFEGRGRAGAPGATGAAASTAPVPAVSEPAHSGGATAPTVETGAAASAAVSGEPAVARNARVETLDVAAQSAGASHAESQPSATSAVTAPAEPAIPAEHKDPEPVAAVTAAQTAVPAVTEPAAPVLTAVPPSVPPAPAKPQAPQYKDGTYNGWGTCRHGDIQAEVVIAGGRIASAKISQCWTRYTCSWLDPVVPQVVQRQSPAIDYVSGATQSTDAFYYAVLDALLKAK